MLRTVSLGPKKAAELYGKLPQGTLKAVAKRDAEPFYSHGGSQDGYQTEFFFHPKHDLEIAILTNGGDETYELQSKMMRAILTHYN